MSKSNGSGVSFIDIPPPAAVFEQEQYLFALKSQMTWVFIDIMARLPFALFPSLMFRHRGKLGAGLLGAGKDGDNPLGFGDRVRDSVFGGKRYANLRDLK